jgi:acetolactate decarboxylase
MKSARAALRAGILAGLTAFLLLGCAHGQADFEGEAVYQVSAIDLLLAGDYDGQQSLAELTRHGDHGLGTFNGLDGEMVLVDGQVYQIRTDGLAYRPAPSATTPWAAVFHLGDNPAQAPADTLAEPLDLDGLQAWLDRRHPDQSPFLGIRIDGTFKRVKARSVPAQAKPYPRLAEVVKDQQKVFEYTEVKGTLVGLRSPAAVKGLNVPGYHFHFIDAERRQGGHVLDLTLGEVKVRTRSLARLALELPRQGEVQAAAESPEKAAELRAVERGR